MAVNRVWAAVGAGCVALMASGSPAAAQAQAQAQPEARAEILQRLLDCRKEADSAARLACYDAQVAAVDQAEAKGDIVIVDREQARAVRRQAFGFTLPSMSLFERGEKPEELDSVSGVIRSVGNRAGKWVVELQDGAVWVQTDNEYINRSPAPGMTVSLRRAAMGGYFMNVDGQRAVRARREK